LRKAEEFLSTAVDSFDGGRFDAAASNAIHAGINGSDAITGWRLSKRSAAADHMSTVDLLAGAGSEGASAARHLRRLLPLKNLAEYDYASVTRERARTALRAGEAIVDIARRVMEPAGGSAGPPPRRQA
jgi:uncharacterized protein (UPF0332 family)